MTTAYVRLLWTGRYLSATPLYRDTVAAWFGHDPYLVDWQALKDGAL